MQTFYQINLSTLLWETVLSMDWPLFALVYVHMEGGAQAHMALLEF